LRWRFVSLQKHLTKAVSLLEAKLNEEKAADKKLSEVATNAKTKGFHMI